MVQIHCSLMYLYKFFSVILTFSVVMTVIATNPIQSVFWLVLSFLAGAALLISLKIDFIPLILIIVYVGAIVILFLFVVMMLEINQHSKSPVYNITPILIIFTIPIGTNIEFFVFKTISMWDQTLHITSYSFKSQYELKIISHILYTDYIFPLIILTILLLIGLVGAIILGLEGINRRKQELSTQQRRNNSWI